MERSRLYTVTGLEMDEPITTESYICSFNNLVVKCVSLDDILKSPDGNLKRQDYIVEIETKLLKEVKELMLK
jgi:WD repeat-containing protein 35